MKRKAAVNEVGEEEGNGVKLNKTKNRRERGGGKKDAH